jgi:Putative metallopeptidase
MHGKRLCLEFRNGVLADIDAIGEGHGRPTRPFLRPSWLLRRRQTLLFLLFAFMFATERLFAQSIPNESEAFQERLDEAALALGSSSRFKDRSPQYRQKLAEFVSGNILFVICHEVAHAAMTQMKLPVLGRAEDAADSFATLRLIRIGSAFSRRVLAEATKGWFLSARRDQETGDKVVYYDEHGLDQQRAYQIVCLMVGSDKDKFKDLASDTKLPEDRQDTCAGDYSDASYAWDLLLKPHLRSPDQPKTKIDVVYGEAKAGLSPAARAARSILFLETVAQNLADTFVWPASFTLEMQSCGFPNARWVLSTHKLTVCYELAADFAELYRAYGAERADSRKRKSK